MKRNFIESICQFHLINYKDFCNITGIPYRTMQNWLYNTRTMPIYMESLIYNTFRVVYGFDVHDTFFSWYYTSEVDIPIKYRKYTQSILHQIEEINNIRKEIEELQKEIEQY